MKCGITAAKYIVAFLNYHIVLLGIAIIVVGGVGIKKAQSFDSVLESNAGVGAILLIVFGIAVSLISFFGCCGAIMENRCMILSYAILLIVIVILNLALVVHQFNLRKNVKSSKVYDAMLDYFKKHNNTKGTTNRFVALQKTFKCCGVDGANDWGSNIPESCCRKEPEIGWKCPYGDLLKEGCWTKVEVLADVFITSGVICIVSMLILVALIVFVFRLASAVRNKEGAS